MDDRVLGIAGGPGGGVRRISRDARALLLAIVAGVFLAGLACSFGPQEDPSRFYVLTSLQEMEADTAVDETPALAGVTVAVGPVTFPEYLERQEIVSRVSGNEVELHDFNRWAEPVDKGFTRVLHENLTRLLAPAHIVNFPWFSSVKVDYAVELQIIRFEPNSIGAGELRCRWTLAWMETPSVAATAKWVDGGDVRYVEPAGSGEVGASVEAMSRAVEALSGDVAAAVVRAVGATR